MDVRALVIFGGSHEQGAETVAGVPAASLDVLGRPMLQRVLDRVRSYGIADITVVSEHTLASPPQAVRWSCTQGHSPWGVAQKAFEDISLSSADLVLMMRVGAYAEIDYEDLVQFHLGQANRVTTVAEPDGEPLGVFLIQGRRRNDAAYLLRHGLKTSRVPNSFYEFAGYVNRLSCAADLRRLAVDAFCGNAELAPEGVEIKPGVWAAPTAMIHKRARVLAPAYIGAHAKVRAAAVVTRCSVLEHHAVVDCGTVVDNATLLANTSVGAGLDVAQAVVGFRRFAHLGRNVEVEIADPKLVGTVSTAPVRFLGQVASLAAFLPAQLLRGFARRGESEQPATLPDTVQAPVPALQDADEQLPSNFVVARRYGNE